ncbi:MAG: phosphopentomutase [Rhodobacteraceae bacterium]|nr:phosphopentomutase [Paracoccaceae bacterium]
MPRAFLVVMDSVGCGGAPDADAFFNDGRPDTGSNTLGHIAQACASGQAEEGRSGRLHIPHLADLGLYSAVKLASGMDVGADVRPAGLWGAATEVSRGKDTPSGHWELAGVPVPWDWHYFPNASPAFPQDLSRRVAEAAGTDGILGNRHASGTVIIEQEGAHHIETGWPICYTSADSVFQIAAHEEHFGLERLLKLCTDIAPILHEMKVGRVIARPFVGAPGGFQRTKNRRDYAIDPPSPTLCDWVQQAGHPVHAIGKIGDIFSMRGIDDVAKGSDDELMEHWVDHAGSAADGSLVFANFVEFDAVYGHRRDVSGYARHLEWFDSQLPRVFEHLRPGDLVVLTADHGNDPTWSGTDHTRERVPLLARGYGAGEIGLRAFVDVGASVAAHLGVTVHGPGESFL